MEDMTDKQKSRIVSVRFGSGELNFLSQAAEKQGYSIGQAVRECVLHRMRESAGSDEKMMELIKQGFAIVIEKIEKLDAVQCEA